MVMLWTYIAEGSETKVRDLRRVEHMRAASAEAERRRGSSVDADRRKLRLVAGHSGRDDQLNEPRTCRIVNAAWRCGTLPFGY